MFVACIDAIGAVQECRPMYVCFRDLSPGYCPDGLPINEEALFCNLGQWNYSSLLEIKPTFPLRGLTAGPFHLATLAKSCQSSASKGRLYFSALVFANAYILLF